jgi:hypothetical protein
MGVLTMDTTIEIIMKAWEDTIPQKADLVREISDMKGGTMKAGWP